ncbi:MAG TPA: LacI family DNA-binding transcriptional regulator [Firmicutes bacterium]|nr:LacI family DNA-binding transcriptional regulator [Bacillota bacterium]
MATIRDVAAACGLNVGTVSRVINNRGYISKETREKVYAAMEALHYRPNEVARALSRQRTNAIGLIVPHISHPYFAGLISCMEQAASQRGYKLIVTNSHADKERERAYLEMLDSNRVDGVVLCSADVDSRLFTGLQLPVVLFERWEEETCVSVLCDNRQGGRLAAEALLAGGCRKLLCFGGVENVDMPADLRRVGFEQACREAGAACISVQTKSTAYFMMDYRAFIREAFTAHPDVDGVFASSDLIGAQVLQFCAETGRRVPEDIQLVGFDDVLLARLTVPRLTSVRQPLERMAAAAVEAIEKRMAGQKVDTPLVYPVTLTVRESTKNAVKGPEGE